MQSMSLLVVATMVALPLGAASGEHVELVDRATVQHGVSVHYDRAEIQAILAKQYSANCTTEGHAIDTAVENNRDPSSTDMISGDEKRAQIEWEACCSKQKCCMEDEGCQPPRDKYKRLIQDGSCGLSALCQGGDVAVKAFTRLGQAFLGAGNQWSRIHSPWFKKFEPRYQKMISTADEEEKEKALKKFMKVKKSAAERAKKHRNRIHSCGDASSDTSEEPGSCWTCVTSGTSTLGVKRKCEWVGGQCQHPPLMRMAGPSDNTITLDTWEKCPDIVAEIAKYTTPAAAHTTPAAVQNKNPSKQRPQGGTSLSPHEPR